QRSELDQLHDHLRHIVVQSHNFTLLHVPKADLESCVIDEDNGSDVDEHIGDRIEEGGKPSHELVQFCQSQVALVEFLNSFFFPAESADHTNAGKIFSCKAGHRVQFALNPAEQRDTEIHDYKDNQEQYRYRGRENKGAANIDGESHHHGADNDKGASEQKPKAHVQAVLHLIDIIGKSEIGRAHV